MMAVKTVVVVDVVFVVIVLFKLDVVIFHVQLVV